VDLNHRPRPYQGLLWCHMHSNYRVWVEHSALDRMLGPVKRKVPAEIVEKKEQFGTVSFTSTKVVPAADPNKFQVEGDFTLRGFTRPVTLQVTLDRDGKGGGQIFADLAFDRRDFGMTQSVPVVHVGDSVRVRLDISFALKTLAAGFSLTNGKIEATYDVLPHDARATSLQSRRMSRASMFGSLIRSSIAAKAACPISRQGW
jgi:hypothetical protein